MTDQQLLLTIVIGLAVCIGGVIVFLFVRSAIHNPTLVHGLATELKVPEGDVLKEADKVTAALKTWVNRAISTGLSEFLLGFNGEMDRLDAVQRKALADGVYSLIPETIWLGPLPITRDLISKYYSQKQWEDFVEREYKSFKAWALQNRDYFKDLATKFQADPNPPEEKVSVPSLDDIRGTVSKAVSDALAAIGVKLSDDVNAPNPVTGTASISGAGSASIGDSSMINVSFPPAPDGQVVVNTQPTPEQQFQASVIAAVTPPAA